ncbi:MAG TPA: hypothetical protein VF228_03590 [Iamia sp.]
MTATTNPSPRPLGSGPDDPDGPPHGGWRRLRRRLILPGIAAVALQVLVAAGDVVPAVDTLVYLESGRNLFEGNGFTRFGGPELHFPPLVPTALGFLLEVFGTPLAAVKVWEVLTGLALVAAVTALARRLWDDDDVTVTAAWIGGALSGLGPMLVRRGSGSEGITAALLIAALVLVLGPPSSAGGGRRGLGPLVGAGALAGLAYLARPEALLPALVMGAALLVDGFRRRERGLDPSAAMAFGLGLALLVAPYLVYLHSNTGSWSPTSKSQDVSVEAWRAVAEDDREWRDQILYAIDESGTDFANDTTSLTSLARQHPRAWLGIFKVNVLEMADIYLVPGSDRRVAQVPLPLLLAAAAAAIKARRRSAVWLTLTIGALPVATCLFFFTQPRYVVMTTVVIAAFSAGGIVSWYRRLPARWPWALAVAVVLWTGVSYVAESWPMLPGITRRESDDHAYVGQWLRENTDPDDRIMTRSFHVQYYGRRPVVALPAAGYDAMMTFARARGVHYIVADERTIRTRRAQLYEPLFLEPTPPGLREVAVIGRGSRMVRIFELDPLPPPSELPPLPLGFVGD